MRNKSLDLCSMIHVSFLVCFEENPKIQNTTGGSRFLHPRGYNLQRPRDIFVGVVLVRDEGSVIFSMFNSSTASPAFRKIFFRPP